MNYRKCSSDATELRQKQFVQSLLELLEEKEYADISVGDIYTRAGFSRTSYYRYFDGKDGCLHALIDYTIQNLHLGYDIYSNGKISMTRCLEYWKSHHALLDMLYKNHMVDFLLERMVFFSINEQSFSTYLAGSRADGTSEQVVFMIGGMVSILFHWYLSDYRKDTEELGAVLERLVEQALTSTSS